MTQQFSCGLDVSNVRNLQESLENLTKTKPIFNFISFLIVHPRFRRRFIAGKPVEHAFTRTDMLLSPSEWSVRVVGRLSAHLDADCEEPAVRRAHEDALTQELDYCRGLGLPAILMRLTHHTNVNRARIINTFLAGLQSNLQLWVEVPLEAPGESAFQQPLQEDEVGECEEREESSPWLWWSSFHRLVEWDRRIGVVLRVTSQVPAAWQLERWAGEPVRCLLLPTHVFLTNKKGFPTLSKALQAFVVRMMWGDVQLLITGAPLHGHGQYTLYSAYLHYLWNSRPLQADSDPMRQFAKGWEDFLQTPLQPLSDNLDSHTYSVFERDPVKYESYQAGVLQALKDRPHTEVVMVLGAGRGPLVRAVLNAASMAGCVNIQVYAVEKNPTALIALYAQQRELPQWRQHVTVVATDMRDWTPPRKADILVSELLGSFGDNELSPECLDGARHLLKEDGVCIPCSYTSYVAPIMSPRLWSLVRSSPSPSANSEPALHGQRQLETLWVVYQQNKYTIAPAQPLFTFSHPGGDTDNRRWCELSFPVPHSCVLHGFSGYFRCVLYPGHELSICPDDHSQGMISWFPVLCPIKEPITLKAGEEVKVNFWRCCGPRKVWYEWAVTSPRITAIHNIAGCSQHMAL